jgi:single-strand DNA-binding protein
MWDKAAEFAEKYIRKGTRLLVEGKIRTRYWEDRNAIKRRITEIYVDNFEVLPK